MTETTTMHKAAPDKGISTAVRRLKGMGYRVTDVSNDPRHKGYDLICWRNGQMNKVGVKSVYRESEIVSRRKPGCDMTVVSVLKTGSIQIV